MYLTYDEFCTMGGTLAEPIFNRFCTIACAKIDAVTFGRVQSEFDTTTSYLAKLKACVFELIPLVEQAGTLQQVATEKNENVSVSYQVANSATLQESIRSTIIAFLSGCENNNGIPLLYRGTDV